MKVKIDGNEVIFYCPGCGTNHSVLSDKWTFNNDVEKPTISPSVLVKSWPIKICHFFVQDGKISYLHDCEHELKDKVVDMVDIR
jgi:hypothetical protein